MDYITGGRVRKASAEKLGALPELLGHSSPDVLAVGVAALPTVLFVLGLEPWHGLRTMLNLVVLSSVAFFVGAGALEADPANWAHGFLPAGLSGLVSGSAMSTLAFVGLHSVVAEGRRERALHLARTATKSGRSSARGQHPSAHRHATGGAVFSNTTSVALASLTSLALAFASYFAVATTLTMMVQFRSLSAGTPLVQAFEVRDVDWARLVMAALGIAALALALVEASPPLHRATVSLSAPDGLLPRRLAKEHPRTATPALAILTSGLLAAALAFLATPLALLRLASAAPLLAHSLAAVDIIRRRYQPTPPPPAQPEEEEEQAREGGRNRRRAASRSHPAPPEDRTRTTVKTLKDGLAFLRKETGMSQSDKAAYQSLPTSEEMAAATDEGRGQEPSPASTPPGPEEEPSPALDEEPLLSSAQDSDPIEAGCMASSSEDGAGGGGGGVGAGEGCESGLSGYESDSNTDIDAIVAEYKERLRVATLDGSVGKSSDSTPGDGQAAEPSEATGRRVTMALCGLLACSLAAGGSVLLLASGAGVSAIALAAASSFVAFLLLALVARQPQGRGECPPGSFRMPLVPWLPGVSLCLHVALLLQVLVSAWMPFLAWTLVGGCLYYWKRGRRRRSSPAVPPGWGSRRCRGGDPQSHHCVPHRRAREQVRLRPPPRHSVVSSLIPSHRRAPDETIRRLTQVDTILITR